jgi:hypothetical protein
MENKNGSANLAQKFISVPTTIEGPEQAENGKSFMRVKFQISDDDDDGYNGQSRAYTKCFFEDSHSLQYARALQAMEKDVPLKIKGYKLTKDLFMPDGITKKLYYVTEIDKKGKTVKRMNSDNEPIVANRLAGFFLADENPEAYFNNQIKRITKAGMWVEMPTVNDEGDLEIG